ncbi:protein kinase domain-containing protein [Rhodococcus sp. MSC1_016]|jgi:predicted ATPase/DNA-binding NarL/FixJ family response regulator|uniref:protein kinase domain-containing protein n=1 Tax=Rhodococcus sp. MSC1_016 TaxID=2909266 RepID=UPI002030A5D3|nr:protein kinase [Rhodococcus sp. MSC1_016]
MNDVDPFATRPNVVGSVVADLAAAGFADAAEIGRGGFGVVYRCRQTALERTVAVKVLTGDLDEDSRARFLREQRAAGRLTGHPNVVNVLQVGVTEHDRPYIVMPFYRHDSLDARIRRRGPLTLEEVLRVGVKIAGALEAAHGLGILHRDVKPANILLTGYGEPALTDFGIAHISGGFETTAGVVTGSPAFTAPEVIAGGAASPAADVYGLGATVFAAATGHAAFERRSGEQLVAQFVRITTEPTPDPREHGIANDVSTVIEAAMANDPAGRPSVGELGQQLRHLQHQHGYPVDDMAGSTFCDDTPPAHPPHDDAPPAAHSVRTGALPLELTSFIDRREETAKVASLLSTARMVTLTGMGGVGKTRLALRVADRTQSRFADGVFLIELGELRDDSLLVAMVADALGLRDRSAGSLLEVLAEFLAPREVLLVLDNCEQVLDAVAKLSEALLRTSSGLRILLTSREPIGISGEVAIPIAPLAVPDADHLPRRLPGNDAVALFAERGAAVLPGFEITDDNKVTIARICQRLDGLPLAIELAAARLRAISPEEILQRLTDRYRFLTRGCRDAPSRQQTLRMCIDWSYDLCTPLEQLMWARLSMFDGSFELNAAEQIFGHDQTADDLLDTVTFLVDKSILIREQSAPVARFRMLETVRDYGREKVRAGADYSELRTRYRKWYVQLASDAEADWVGPRQLEWLTRLVAELPNLRQAHEICLSEDPESGLGMAAALFPLWFSRGLLTEGRRWTERLLALSPRTVGIDRAKAILWASVMAGLQGDLQASITLIQEGRTLADQSADPLLQAHIDLAEGYRALYGGDVEYAQIHFEAARPIYAAVPSALALHILLLEGLGIAYELLDHTERAIECYESALAVTEEHGEAVHRSYSLWALAVVVWRHANTERANDLLQQALRAARKVNERLVISMCLQALAWIAAEEGAFERAVILTSAAENLSHAMGSSPMFVSGLVQYRERCEHEARKALSKNAFSEAQRKGNKLGVESAVAYALGEQSPASYTPTTGQAGPTKREREVAELVAEGLTNREIASRLTISVRTVQGHIEHLLAKLGFTSRAQIAAWVESRRTMP